MRRRCAANAEIARRIDDAAAEQMSPNAVHPNAGGERIVAAGDGLGHFAAAAAVLECDRLVVGRQNRDETPIDFGAGAAGIAAEEDDRVVRLVVIDQQRRRIFARLFGRAGEYAVQCVVVGRADRIELVIVAAGARDREAHHAARDDVDAVVDDVVLAR